VIKCSSDQMRPNLKGEREVTQAITVWTDGNAEFHREDGPAFIFSLYDIWFRHGVEHRDDGPSTVWKNGESHEWYINGENLTEIVEEWLVENEISWPFSEEETMLFKLRFA
jgi:hypothetical protein